MKKFFILILAVSAMTAVLYAEDAVQITIPQPTAVNTPAASDMESNAGWQAFRLTLDLDFTTVGMKQANDYMNTRGYKVTGFGGGFIGVLDLGIAVYPFLLVGPRVGYLYSLPASYKWNAKGTDPDPTLKKEIQMDATMIPLELGARLRFGIPGTTVAASTGAYAGVCFAHVANNVDASNSMNKPASYIQAFDGLGFSAEWTVSAEIKLMKGVDFNINGGYRMAGVVNVKQSENAYFSFYNGTTIVKEGYKGDLMQDATGTSVAFDYSGLNIGVGISLGL
jgi:hypothetical protein